MSEDQLKAFMEAVEANTALQEKLNAAVDADAIVGIAKEALENPSSPRENTRVIARTYWAHGQQAARIQ